jgi:hypothetical protein
MEKTSKYCLEVGQSVPIEKINYFDLVVKQLNAFHANLKRTNPRGYLDQFDQQWENICLDIAMSLGGTVDFKDNNFTACFTFV